MNPSGKFVVRVGPDLHSELRKEAIERGLSLNDLCLKRLSTRQPESGHQHFNDILSQARELYCNDLLAVVVYGSWVRGEATESSDVDILLVLKKERKIVRSLYREWDNADDINIDNLPVQVNFTNPPESEKHLSGFWAEISIDGMVIWDPSLWANRFLAKVRAYIADGRLKRYHTHGQPYWVFDDEEVA